MALGRSAFNPELLMSGSSGDIVVIDFHGTAGEKTLGERVAAMPHADWNVYQIDPVRDMSAVLDGDAAIPVLEEVAAAYSAPFASDLKPGLVVVGVCSAGTLALRIAAALSQRVSVKVVLLRPTWPDPALIGEIFTDLRAGLQAAGEPSSPSAFDGNPERALQEALRILRVDASAMAAKTGISPQSPLFEQLIGRYRGWLGFLLASRDALLNPWAGGLPVHVYAEPGNGGPVPWLPEGTYAAGHLDGPGDESWLPEALGQACP